MLVVKKFGGTSVGNKDRIMNVAKRCITKKEMMLLLSYQQWVR